MRPVRQEPTASRKLALGRRQGVEHAELNRGPKRLRPPIAHEIRRKRGELAAQCWPKLDDGLARLGDDLEPAVQPFDARLAVVERLDSSEAPPVSRATAAVDVHPTALVARAREPLVEDVEVQEPTLVEEAPVPVDVGRSTILRLHDGDVVPEVSCVPPVIRVGTSSRRRDVVVSASVISNRAAGVLEVAAPREGVDAQVRSARSHVMPPTIVDDSSEPFVEAERPAEASRVGRPSARIDVPGGVAAAHRRETRRVELEHLIEARFVDRPPIADVMSRVRGNLDVGPVHRAPPFGVRMLQPMQSGRVRYPSIRAR